MRFLALVVVVLSIFSSSARASDSIVGRWAYFMKIYKGQEMPEGPGATLRLRYEFLPNGQSRLYWWHEGQNEHCERRGYYRVENGHLIDRVYWVDPNNSYGCSRDPDMQNGRETRTPFTFRNGNWVLRLALGEEELLYVWKKITMEEK